MKVIKCEVHNFASYKHLEFNFDEMGVILIHGKTGSGKSTFMDIVPWVLFGRTAKNGAADDVLSWNSSDSTIGTVWLANGDSITRIRSKGGKNNDLYFTKQDVNFRGANVSDTQNLICSELGFVLESFINSAYYHEFASSASFFTAGAKQRRAILENLADFTFAKSISGRIYESRRILSDDIKRKEIDLSAYHKQLAFLTRQEEQGRRDFLEKQIQNLRELSIKLDSLESTASELPGLRKKLAILKDKDVCTTCGHTTHNKEYHHTSNEIVRAQQAEQLAQRTRLEIEHIKTEKPHKPVLLDIEVANITISDLTKDLNILKEQTTDIDVLDDVLQHYRTKTIENTISQVETKTNDYLSKYFDAEISIVLLAEDADKIDAVIYKDGNKCSIGQLSKGQRTLLKFCFGVSVMQLAANHNGVSFKQLFFDEALDGLDDNLKLKSCNMLLALSLEYDTIFIVEHSSEMKAHIDNKYEVQLNNEGNSELRM